MVLKSDGVDARAQAPTLPVMERKPKRPRDPAQLAKLIVDIATGEVEKHEPSPKEIRAYKGGSKGGPARAHALTPDQRSEIARAAASARWKKGA